MKFAIGFAMLAADAVAASEEQKSAGRRITGSNMLKRFGKTNTADEMVVHKKAPKKRVPSFEAASKIVTTSINRFRKTSRSADKYGDYLKYVLFGQESNVVPLVVRPILLVFHVAMTIYSMWWDKIGRGQYTGPYNYIGLNTAQKAALDDAHTVVAQPELSLFTIWGLLANDLSMLCITIITVGASLGAWPQRSTTSSHDPVPRDIAGFAKFTSIWESANFAFDVVIVVVFWLLIFPGDNENVPGGLQGMDLGMKVLDHAILPGLFFTEYMISRVPIDSRGFYWYAYAAVGVGYIVTNMVVTTIMNVPVYSILPWFTAGSTGIGKSFAYGAGCIAIGFVALAAVTAWKIFITPELDSFWKGIF